jgi:NAD(P)-dependent dehydrogenase (short-subunit alcohol dehydrogenase family)
MAQAFAEVGVRGIAILDVQQEIGDKAARNLGEQTGVDAWFYRVDVRDADAVGQTIKNVVDHFGEVNVLVNAAGIAE